jgi:hypothetical protein
MFARDLCPSDYYAENIFFVRLKNFFKQEEQTVVKFCDMKAL